jgi:hypothetical protein
VQAGHLQRSAIVYIRPSTPHQIIDNRESTERQYALVHRAVDLGWAAPQVEVIDEDQGKSGSTAEGRLGFQKLLAEPLGIGGPLLLAAAMRVTPRAALRYLQ